jgi:L-lactate utilization protein LutC
MSTSAIIPTVAVEEDFRTRAHNALGDQQLRNNFRTAMDSLMTKRAAAFSDAHEREHLRALGNSIRARALSKLPDLLEQLEQNLTRNGVTVHWAETVDEANGIVLSIIRAHEARQVIKGKSMVSEEMEMNHFLEARDIECLESDMGEYIVQLDHEKPSHIIMPAIHKNAGQVASLFHDKLGVEYTKDVDQLIQIGRRVLRQKFFEADIGVSGVNFAVAETGTLLLVENEGNGRMTTTVPPVHIAVTGIEKVVENLRDVVPLAVAADALGAGHSDHHLRQHDLRPAQGTRTRRPAGSASGVARQRSQPGFRRQRIAPDPELHPLRRLHESLPGLHPRRRPHLWRGLSGADRQNHHPAHGRSGESPGSPERVVAVRCLR